MRIKNLITIPITMAIFSGCATVPAGLAGVTCEGVKIRTITIHMRKDSEIRVTPTQQTVKQGRALRFKVNGDRSLTATVSGKTSPTDDWIAGSGSGGQEFYVCVDPGQDTAPTYRYGVNIPGLGFIDPRVRVRR